MLLYVSFDSSNKFCKYVVIAGVGIIINKLILFYKHFITFSNYCVFRLRYYGSRIDLIHLIFSWDIPLTFFDRQFLKCESLL